MAVASPCAFVAPRDEDYAASPHYVKQPARNTPYSVQSHNGHGQIVDAYVSATRDMVAARRFFEGAIISSGTTPRRVITDKAATYPPALADGGAWRAASDRSVSHQRHRA